MKEDEKKVEQYEKTSIKDFSFPLILLLVIAFFSLSAPYVYGYVKKLNEEGFFDNLFHKETVPNPNIENNNSNNNEEIVKADTTGASEPVLKQGMIPVRYNFVLKKWVKADSNNPARNSWYNYEKQEWPNAVIVKESGIKTRKYYEKAKPDVEIQNEDIIGFFVWIPRFKYSLVSSTGIQQINVEFESASTTKSTGPNSITHPAFTLGSSELEGFWIGKFEITGTYNDMKILPYQNAVTNQNISYMFSGIQGMHSNNYGLSSDSTLRLIRNTEWGAVAYLTNSVYGICKNKKCSTLNQYDRNYNTDFAVTSSTTSNITGVYALNGGVSEYVMGNNSNMSGMSGFNEEFMTNKRVNYDIYNNGSSQEYDRGILGDATKEFGPFNNNTSSWNNSSSIFVDENNPWFVRDTNGIYSFGSANGGANYSIGFRMVIN